MHLFCIWLLLATFAVPTYADRHAWSDEPDYEKLIGHTEVRKLITKCAKDAPQNLSASEFLRLLDLAAVPLTRISMTSIADALIPIYRKTGISTGKSTQKKLSYPIQEVIVRTLCSLAKNGYSVNTLENANNGLIILSEIPSDMWTFGGDILITIQGTNAKTQVEIKVKIPGQIYDWGKSNSVINHIISDIEGLSLASP